MTAKLAYLLEDEFHAQRLAELPSREAAVAAARQRFELAWDGPENRAPCSSWRGCGSDVVVADRPDELWREVTREPLYVADGARWVGADSP